MADQQCYLQGRPDRKTAEHEHEYMPVRLHCALSVPAPVTGPYIQIHTDTYRVYYEYITGYSTEKTELTLAVSILNRPSPGKGQESEKTTQAYSVLNQES